MLSNTSSANYYPFEYNYSTSRTSINEGGIWTDPETSISYCYVDFTMKQALSPSNNFTLVATNKEAGFASTYATGGNSIYVIKPYEITSSTLQNKVGTFGLAYYDSKFYVYANLTTTTGSISSGDRYKLWGFWLRGW